MPRKERASSRSRIGPLRMPCQSGVAMSAKRGSAMKVAKPQLGIASSPPQSNSATKSSMLIVVSAVTVFIGLTSHM